jgi:putative FmdB family regulatory protein
MPVYEYICTSCESTFEKLMRMSAADDAVSCPECQGDARRKLSLFAAFSKSESGQTASVGGGGGCAGCAGGGCAGCGHH